MKTLIAMLLTFCLLLPMQMLDASSCRFNSHVAHRNVYHAGHGNAYHGHQIFAVPLYSLGHYSQGTTVESLSILEEMKKLREDHNQLLRVLSTQAGGQTFGDAPHVAVLRQHCADCHSPGNAKGGFTLFGAGGLADLNPEQMTLMVQRMSTQDPTKKMPPPARSKLTLDEFAAVMEGIVSK